MYIDVHDQGGAELDNVMRRLYAFSGSSAKEGGGENTPPPSFAQKSAGVTVVPIGNIGKSPLKEN